jgi:hypothetical protein
LTGKTVARCCVLLAYTFAADVPSLICMRCALLAPLVNHGKRGFFCRFSFWQVFEEAAWQSGLALGNMNDKSVQAVAHLDLTGQT